jgi:hypothetical protein
MSDDTSLGNLAAAVVHIGLLCQGCLPAARPPACLPACLPACVPACLPVSMLHAAGFFRKYYMPAAATKEA